MKELWGHKYLQLWETVGRFFTIDQLLDRNTNNLQWTRDASHRLVCFKLHYCPGWTIMIKPNFINRPGLCSSHVLLLFDSHSTPAWLYLHHETETLSRDTFTLHIDFLGFFSKVSRGFTPEESQWEGDIFKIQISKNTQPGLFDKQTGQSVFCKQSVRHSQICPQTQKEFFFTVWKQAVYIIR